LARWALAMPSRCSRGQRRTEISQAQTLHRYTSPSDIASDGQECQDGSVLQYHVSPPAMTGWPMRSGRSSAGKGDRSRSMAQGYPHGHAGRL
jgi:hypothetical protein